MFCYSLQNKLFEHTLEYLKMCFPYSLSLLMSDSNSDKASIKHGHLTHKFNTNNAFCIFTMSKNFEN